MEPTLLKKHLKKLKILLHPDKNRDNQELAKKVGAMRTRLPHKAGAHSMPLVTAQAFEAVGEAQRMLEDEAKMSFVHKVLDEAKEKTKFQLAEKRAQAKKAKEVFHDTPAVVCP